MKTSINQLTVDKQQLINAEQAWHYRIIPHDFSEDSLTFYVADNRQDYTDLEEELALLFGKRISLTSIPEAALEESLYRYYRQSKTNTKKDVAIDVNDVENFLFELIKEAKQIESSDIHIETYENLARVRFRIDGKLVEKYYLNKPDYPSLVNKIKIQANLDISEKRLPQDGRIFFEEGAEKFDLRVSILPTLYGEKIVLRILGNDAKHLDLESLGLSDQQLNLYTQSIKKPNGIILISGPTGSGKTTTLYATLKQLNNKDTNILTIEDPIEYTLEGINQVQLKEGIGLDFAAALKSFLRQDPDIVMLGEIRDVKTAEMAIRTSLTGHLVFSTIHTNSSFETITRLIDMGVPRFMIASTLNASVAQRLVRLLCDSCKTSKKTEPGDLPNHIDVDQLTSSFHPVGCPECYYTGYKGRKAIYEILYITKELSEYIKNDTFEQAKKQDKIKVDTLADQAFQLLKEGHTSLAEVYPLLLDN